MNNLLKIPTSSILSLMETKQTEINMALFNVRALTNKSFCINDLISDFNLDCLFLTETWLGTDAPATLIETCPPGFTYSFSTRNGKRGGGTAAIYRENLKGRDIDLGTFITFEYNAILLNFQPRLLAVTLYRSPKSPISTFIKDFSDMLSVIHMNYDNCVLTGDFNIHVDNLSDIRSNEFLELLEQYLAQQYYSAYLTGMPWLYEIPPFSGLVVP